MNDTVTMDTVEPISHESAEFVEAPELHASMSTLGNANAEHLKASFSAIGSAKAGMLEATGSAIALSKVEGDAEFTLSSTPFVYAKGDAAMRWSYASAFVAGSEVTLSQSVTAATVARKVTFDAGASAAVVAGKASIRRGWVGLLLSGKTELHDGARVVIGTRGALIIAAALLGGFGFIALAVYLGARRLSTWRPELPDLAELMRSYRHHA